MGRLLATGWLLAALPLTGCGAGFLSEAQREAIDTGCAPAGRVHALWKAPVEVQRCIDDTKCRQLGFKPGTEAYGNCRLQLEQIRATAASTTRVTRGQNVAVQGQGVSTGRKVYDTSECIGPIIMGECKGAILPNRAYHPTCHGEMLNGQCTGPMF